LPVAADAYTAGRLQGDRQDVPAGVSAQFDVDDHLFAQYHHAHAFDRIKRTLAIDFQRVNEELGKGAVAADQLDYVTLSNGSDFIGQCALGEEKLREFTSDISHVNTDNLPYAEFYRKLGRKIYRQNRECPALILSDIMRYKENAMPYVVNVPDSEKAGWKKRWLQIIKATV